MFPEKRLRPTGEDLLRALGYLAIMVWTVLFLIFPPSAYVDTVDLTTRLLWVGACFIGAAAAFTGALLRIDLKLELPGIGVMLVGPIFYSAAQIWYTIWPPATTTDPTALIALIVYAIIPAILVLPRMYSLYNESQKASALRKEMKKGIEL